MKRHEYRDAMPGSALSPTQRHVLLCLAERAADRATGELRVCWPGQDDIAWRTGLTVRAVRSAVKAAEAKGWLVVIREHHRESHRYMLTVPDGWVAPPRPLPERRSALPEGDSALPEGDSAQEDKKRTRRGQEEDMSLSCLEDNTMNPEVNMTTQDQLALPGTPESSAPPQEAAPDSAPPPPAWSAAMAQWVALAKRAGVTRRGHDLTSPDGKALNARLKQHGPEAVANVMRWYWLSNHERAEFLRRSGELITPMRPAHFEKYLAWAEEMPAPAPAPKVHRLGEVREDPWAERRAARLARSKQ